MQQVERSIDVEAPQSVCYDYWTKFTEFPVFMRNVQDVRSANNDYTNRAENLDIWHWRVLGPFGRYVEWDAQVDMRDVNHRISWHSLPGSDIDISGQVLFEAISPIRTRIIVSLQYSTPGGAIGDTITQIFKDPERMISEDIRYFKQRAEQAAYTAPEYKI